MHVRLCCVQACVHGVGMGLVVEGDGYLVVFGICRISDRPACLWIRDGSVMVAA